MYCTSTEAFRTISDKQVVHLSKKKHNNNNIHKTALPSKRYQFVNIYFDSFASHFFAVIEITTYA